jgi:uncharacterized protein (TIGR02118 family)
MYIVTITYPKTADATFDFGYFRHTHLPAVGNAFSPFGLGYASVLRGQESLDGGDPAYFAISILSFASEEGARNAIKSDAGLEVLADAANFTNVAPVMQFNTSVG